MWECDARYDRRMDVADNRVWASRLRSVGDAQDREGRERAAAMSVGERLEAGVKLSMFAVRMREAFGTRGKAP